MRYVCIENDLIIGVFDYEPNAPQSVEVVEISDIDHRNIADLQTHYFDVSSRSVLPYSSKHLSDQEQETQQKLIDAQNREFLNSTDWKVLRHIREKALNIETSLTEQQYLELEQQRADAANAIINK